MIGVDFVLLILLIGVFGFLAQYLIFPDTQESGILQSFTLRLLSGFAFLSVILLIAAFLGFFYKITCFLVLAILLLWFYWKWRRDASRPAFRLVLYAIFCACVGIASFLVATFTKPYQAIIYSHDAAVYLASAFQLADSGSIYYQDPLVTEMQEEEKKLFFPHRARFAGGVQFWDRSKGIVNFGFAPFFSIWLAFAIPYLGAQGFLSMLSFFTVLGMLVLFLIGKKLSGNLLGVSIPLVVFFFLPQFYFSRFPMSESIAQLLFLSGLFVFIHGSSPGYQRLAGILWGSMFACRIEIIPLLIISLILIFTIHPQYRLMWDRWRTFLLIVTAYAIAVFLWQLASGTYLMVWGITHRSLMQQLWLPPVILLHRFLKTHLFLGGLLLVSISVCLLFVLNLLLKRKVDSRHRRWIGMAGILLSLILVLPLTGMNFDAAQILKHITWKFIYIPQLLVFLLLAGCFSLLIRRVRNSGDHLLLLLFLLIPPALFFFCRPLAPHEQPLFVRRFMVVVFPLFFVLSLSGWLALLLAYIRPSLLGKAVFCILIISLAWVFHQDSASLVRKPLFAGVVEQMKNLAPRLPGNSIVLIPLRESGNHIALPLQFMLGIDTISLPVARDSLHFTSYINRQLGGDRPVYVLTRMGGESSSNFLKGFHLLHEFSVEFVFNVLAPAQVQKIPDRITRRTLRYHGYRVLPALKEDEKQD